MRKETKNIQDLGLIFCVKKNFVNFSLTILWLIDWMNGEEKNNFNHLRPFHHHCIFQIIDLFLWGQKKKWKQKLYWESFDLIIFLYFWLDFERNVFVCLYNKKKVEKVRKIDKPNEELSIN